MIVPPYIKCSADFSDDTLGPDGRGMYRFSLWRRGLLDDDPGAFKMYYDQFCLFICLNPSTASEKLDDPTVRRCWKRSRSLGFGSFCMSNLFAFRATEPKDMKATADPVGEWNDTHLEDLVSRAGLVILGWGSDGAYLDRDRAVLSLLEPHKQKLAYLKLTTHGHHPGHPLYIGYDVKPQPVEPLWNNFLQRTATPA